MDRFLLKIFVSYPTADEERRIYRLTTGIDAPAASKVLSAEEIAQLQAFVRRVPAGDLVVDYTLALVRATRGEETGGPGYVSKWIAWGAGPRAGQAMILAAKARAAFTGARRSRSTTSERSRRRCYDIAC